jgi:hypothetical protein
VKRIYLLALFFSTGAFAQTVTLTASPATAIGSTPVTLTWSTTPVATSCTASGDWTGTKAASGTTTLAAVTTSKSYTLTCTFPTTGAAALAWTPPTTNTDNSPLTNLASYKVYVGSSATTLAEKQLIAAPASTASVTGLATGTWFFAVTAVSATGKESAKSNVGQKTIAALTATASAAVTVTPDTTPNPPTNLTVSDPVVYDIRPNESTFAFDRGRAVGVVKLGAACDEVRTTGGGFYALERPSKVKLSRQPRSVALVAKCSAA